MANRPKGIRWATRHPSASTCTAVLPYLSDLGLQLVKKIIGCAADNPIANQEHRRAFQIELHGKFLVLVERFLDVGVLRVLLKLSDIEPKLLGNPQGLILVSPARLGEQLLVHLKIFALLVRGERKLGRSHRIIAEDR